MHRNSHIIFDSIQEKVTPSSSLNSFNDILIIQEVISQECVSGLSEVNCNHMQIFMLQVIKADKAQKNKSPQQGTLFHKLNQNNTKFFHNQHKTQELNT